MVDDKSMVVMQTNLGEMKSSYPFADASYTSNAIQPRTLIHTTQTKHPLSLTWRMSTCRLHLPRRRRWRSLCVPAASLRLLLRSNPRTANRRPMSTSRRQRSRTIAAVPTASCRRTSCTSCSTSAASAASTTTRRSRPARVRRRIRPRRATPAAAAVRRVRAVTATIASRTPLRTATSTRTTAGATADANRSRSTGVATTRRLGPHPRIVPLIAAARRLGPLHDHLPGGSHAALVQHHLVLVLRHPMRRQFAIARRRRGATGPGATARPTVRIVVRMVRMMMMTATAAVRRWHRDRSGSQQRTQLARVLAVRSAAAGALVQRRRRRTGTRIDRIVSPRITATAAGRDATVR